MVEKCKTYDIQRKYSGGAMDGFQCAEADSDILDIFDGIDLDTLFERYHIDGSILVKMDIEGAEREIFKKIEHAKWITKIKVLAIEIHDQRCNDTNLSQSIVQTCKKYGLNGKKIGDIYVFNKR